MKKENIITLIFTVITIIGILTACGESNNSTNKVSSNIIVHTNNNQKEDKNHSNTQSIDESFDGPYYGTIKKVDSTSIEIELLTIESDSENTVNSDQPSTDNETQKLENQANKLEKPTTFQNSGKILSTTFAPTFQISNAGKTILDLKPGDMIAFSVDNSSNKEIVSINIMQ